MMYWGLEACVKVSLGKSDPVANALVIPSTLRQFFGVDHLHLTPSASATAAQSCQPASGLPRHSPCMLSNVERTDCAINEPEHNRIGNVEFVKRLYCHLYSPIIALGDLIYICKESKNIFLQILQTTVIKSRHFAAKGLQRYNVCF